MISNGYIHQACDVGGFLFPVSGCPPARARTSGSAEADGQAETSGQAAVKRVKLEYVTEQEISSLPKLILA